MTYSLQSKNNKYYVVIHYRDEYGQVKNKWISTGMTVKGNKKRAVDFAEQVFDDFKASHKEGSDKQSAVICENSLYSDFLQSWLNTIKSNIQESTYQGYYRLVKEISEYFDSQKLHLNQIRPIHIQTYYNKLLERGLSANSVLHYHAIIRKSLQYAHKMDMLVSNPADKIDRPKKAKYKASFYNNYELRDMFEAFKGDPMELIVYVVAYYGFRRSEVTGLKWDCVDFDAKTITIKRKVIEVRINGSHEIISKEELKTESSKRTLPLIPSIEKMLLQRKQEQEFNKKMCLNAYNTKYEDYIFVNDIGDLITPDYITSHFSNVLAKNGLRHIRFHDLRHSCASLLLSCGVPMKEIQLWLGHSNFSTTADIYSHLDYSSKVDAAIKIADVLDNDEK